MPESTSLDLMNPTFRVNPRPIYARLREEAPVQRATIGGDLDVWFVTRYDDVQTVLKDPRFVNDPRGVVSPGQHPHLPEESPSGGASRRIIDVDPPDHTRLRSLVQKAFSAPIIERMRERIQAIADELLDTIEGRGEADLIEAYAFPLPILVIAEMLDVPRKDRDQIREWSNAVTEVSMLGKAAAARAQAQRDALSAYLRDLIEVRRKDPGADLVSALIRAEEDGSKLSRDELLAMVNILLVAGHETTVNLIANGMLALFQHPEQLEALKKDPSLIKTAVEEFLRFNGPAEQAAFRFAREDLELGGARIAKGEILFVCLASANHDGAQFTKPDEFQIARAENKHVGFGFGIHYCVGAPLARMEGQIAIATLLRRLPDIRLAVPPESLAWRPGLMLRGPSRLPVVFSVPR
jgi:cytochrome P450